MSSHYDCKHGKAYWQECKECEEIYEKLKNKIQEGIIIKPKNSFIDITKFIKFKAQIKS